MPASTAMVARLIMSATSNGFGILMFKNTDDFHIISNEVSLCLFEFAF